METFGHYIRRLRNERGFNQTELAALIGLDSAGLSRVENGKKALKDDKLDLLANALKIDIQDLKVQYFSHRFAEQCFKANCPHAVFELAQLKTRDLGLY